MPFKLVQTIEDGKFCHIVVPSAWEDDGVLFWPKGASVAKLLNDGNSVPSQKWDRLNCVVRREYSQRVEAEEELERLEGGGNDGGPPSGKKRRKERRPPSSCSSSSALSTVDFQDPLRTLPRASPDTLIRSKVEAYAYVNPESGTLEALPLEESSNRAPIQQPGSSSQCTHCHVILGNQHKIMLALKQLMSNVSFLMNAVGSGGGGGGGSGTVPAAPIPDLGAMQVHAPVATFQNLHFQPLDADFGEYVVRPVDSLETLKALDEQLRDETVMCRYLNGMSYICGTNGKGNGMDCCYKLIDYFATREFLLQCSWTGSARADKDNPDTQQKKVGLGFYGYFRSLFLQLIRLADKDFTESLCDVFFKRVLKNAKARMNAAGNTLSRSKNRPSQLKYKSKSSAESKPNSGTDAPADGGEQSSWYENV